MKDEPEYTCKLVGKPKPKKVRSRTWVQKYQLIHVEGMTQNRRGKYVPNGINFVVAEPM